MAECVHKVEIKRGGLTGHYLMQCITAQDASSCMRLQRDDLHGERAAGDRDASERNCHLELAAHLRLILACVMAVTVIDQLGA